MSYSLVYRLVAASEIPSQHDESGVITVARRDVKLLALKPKAAADRRAVMLRPDVERYAAWKRAAGEWPVSSWLAELADAAAGWRA